MMDAANVRETTEKMKAQGAPISRRTLRPCLPRVTKTWYKDDPATPVRPAVLRSVERRPGSQSRSLPASLRSPRSRRRMRRGQKEPRRLGHRSRQRRRGHRASLEDERAGRRHRFAHHADAQAFVRHGAPTFRASSSPAIRATSRSAQTSCSFCCRRAGGGVGRG